MLIFVICIIISEFLIFVINSLIIIKIEKQKGQGEWTMLNPDGDLFVTVSIGSKEEVWCLWRGVAPPVL